MARQTGPQPYSDRTAYHSDEATPIYSRSHFAISTLVGVVVALVAGLTPTDAVLVVVYGALLGTLIDLDHFLIARLNTGDWRALRYVLSTPRAVFLDQSTIFAPGEVGALRRLLSHAVIGGVLVVGLSFVSVFLAVYTALILYVHVVSDLIEDVRQAGGVA